MSNHDKLKTAEKVFASIALLSIPIRVPWNNFQLKQRFCISEFRDNDLRYIWNVHGLSLDAYEKIRILKLVKNFVTSY